MSDAEPLIGERTHLFFPSLAAEFAVIPVENFVVPFQDATDVGIE